ncbi:UNVERIFIED_ORG: hypothetical protein QE434_002236 [Rhizobium sp. SORGH_AS 755]|nr:hypothetical protein [Rhizobium sp. SORGH_AS_0755]
MRAFCRASRADAASLGPSPHRTGMVADLETASRLGPAGELAGMTQCELRATSPKPGRRTPDKIDKSKSKVRPQLRPWNLFSRDTAFIQQRDEGFSEVLATIKQIGLFMFQPPQENQLPVAGVVRHSTKSKVGFDFSNRHFTRCNLLKEPIPVFLQHKAHVVGPTRSRFSPTVNITEETLEWRFYVWLTPRQNSEVRLTRAPSDKSWRRPVGNLWIAVSLENSRTACACPASTPTYAKRRYQDFMRRTMFISDVLINGCYCPRFCL